MNDNGRAGIVIDLNRINRAYFRDWWKRLGETATIEKATERGAANDALTGELVERIIVSWPFDQPITPEGYSGLGLLEVEQVDQELQKAIELVIKKK